MAGRNPTAAVKAFVAPIQEALGLFASGNVTADSYKSEVEGVLTFNGGKVSQVTITENKDYKVDLPKTKPKAEPISKTKTPPQKAAPEKPKRSTQW